MWGCRATQLVHVRYCCTSPPAAPPNLSAPVGGTPPTPGRQDRGGATGQRDDVHHAARELHIIGHSYQDGALRRARHKAESLTKMIIGGRAALNRGVINLLVLVVRDLRAKIIKRKGLDQPSVGAGREVLVRRGHGADESWCHSIPAAQARGGARTEATTRDTAE